MEDDELHSFLQFQTSASSIINFRHPYFVLKITTSDQGLLAIICELLLQIQMYRKKVEYDELHSFLQFQTSASSIINFRHPYFVLKITTTDQGLLAIICELLLQIQMYRKKVQGPVFNSQFLSYYTFC